MADVEYLSYDRDLNCRCDVWEPTSLYMKLKTVVLYHNYNIPGSPKSIKHQGVWIPKKQLSGVASRHPRPVISADSEEKWGDFGNVAKMTEQIQKADLGLELLERDEPVDFAESWLLKTANDWMFAYNKKELEVVNGDHVLVFTEVLILGLFLLLFDVLTFGCTFRRWFETCMRSSLRFSIIICTLAHRTALEQLSLFDLIWY